MLISEHKRQLVADGADVNFKFTDMYSWTVLHYAASYGASDVCQLLVRNCSADLEVRGLLALLSYKSTNTDT